ncbi:hypothetical protein K435DRAFT_938387 [Dendrothele bispora CBS 962.96]|uniref:Uncharacterized protein n=1 Tax=Dendrothele bispora (strain CBS 962.96) TaxID=1314807 RepID=A0A4S8MCB0_DENBC|nr:hypothetical protein K435DRAFT_938387 [Dendrothele bispora CBS 962.96]
MVSDNEYKSDDDSESLIQDIPGFSAAVEGAIPTDSESTTAHPPLPDNFGIRDSVPQKRRKLEVSVLETRARQREARQKEWSDALDAIKRLNRSRKTEFQAGRHSLQDFRARAIESTLVLVVKRNEKFVPASRDAAAAHGFAREWGSRAVRKWVRVWIEKRELPASDLGSHAKVFSLFSDPVIRAEIRSFLCSNKWSMDPKKLAKFLNEEMLPKAAKEYMKDIDSEMARGLKKYIEQTLFPRIQLKVKGGISTETCRRLMANDGKKKSWVLDGEQPIWHKGPGRGLHYSGVICSTHGHLEAAGEILEYGKNYDGYWNGELFIKQLKEKIIPVFEEFHPGKKALFLIDNSQGHSAYATDALLTNRMNFNPGGKQARLHDTWFMKGDKKVNQSMVFDLNPAEPYHKYANQPKGMKVYLRDHCDYTFDTLKVNLPHVMKSVDIKTIRRWELRTRRWISAYRDGLGAKDAQLRVRQFSSRKYKSHRRVPETLASQFDS